MVRSMLKRINARKNKFISQQLADILAGYCCFFDNVDNIAGLKEGL